MTLRWRHGKRLHTCWYIPDTEDAVAMQLLGSHVEQLASTDGLVQERRNSSALVVQKA